ncbi:MAG TPA: phosphatidate cytidylyltransferase [Sphingobacterium sp.]|nr:phosphatidate cytidylyltransferase [Sphingobacterium sp.]
MKTRAITGFFFIAVLIGTVLSGPYVFVFSFVAVGGLCIAEFYSMVKNRDTNPASLLGTVTGILMLGAVGLFYLDLISQQTLLYVALPTFIVYICALFRGTERPIQDVAYLLFGHIYAGMPFVFFIGLGFVNGVYSPFVPLGFLILLWTNDTGAYLAGRSLGKRKLFERISPNKTWEGFVGGLLLAVAAALILNYYFGTLSRTGWVAVALITSCFGTLGDLVESMFKRNLGVKDSGKTLPGHGGFLDRFDGLLMAAPLVYLFLKAL